MSANNNDNLNSGCKISKRTRNKLSYLAKLSDIDSDYSPDDIKCFVCKNSPYYHGSGAGCGQFDPVPSFSRFDPSDTLKLGSFIENMLK